MLTFKIIPYIRALYLISIVHQTEKNVRKQSNWSFLLNKRLHYTLLWSRRSWQWMNSVVFFRKNLETTPWKCIERNAQPWLKMFWHLISRKSSRMTSRMPPFPSWSMNQQISLAQSFWVWVSATFLKEWKKSSAHFW